MSGKKYLAVEIGNKNIKLVYGGVNKNRIEINEYDIFDTPLNAIRDGKILSLNAITEAILSSAKKFGIRGNKLILNITGTSVITRDVQIPKATDDEIEKILEFEAQQYFPVDLENYSMDYKVTDNIENSEGSFNKLFLAAVPLKQVDEYMKLPIMLKKNITAIDLNVNCLTKFLFGQDLSIGEEQLKATGMPVEMAVLDIGSETTGVSIFHSGKLRFSRILLNGSGDIDRHISNSFGIDFKEAENMKISGDYSLKENNDEKCDYNPTELDIAIKSALNNIISDISRFFEFYNSRGSGNKIEKIYVYGGGSKLKGLEEYVSGYFGIPVEQLRVDKKVVYKGKRKPEAFSEDFVYILNAVGALVRQ